MKGLYLELAGKYYQVEQTFSNTMTPAHMINNHMSVSLDAHDKVAGLTVTADNIDLSKLETNKESFDRMKKKLVTDGVTDIQKFADAYKAEIEYTILDDIGAVSENCKVMKTIISNDKLFILGIDSDNEMHYRLAKELTEEIHFVNHKAVPYGVMVNPIKGCTIVINNIRIYQCIVEETETTPVQEKVYGVVSTDTDSLMEGSLCIFDTRTEGIKFDPVTVPFVPREIWINVCILLGNYIQVYNTMDVDLLLQQISDAGVVEVPGKTEETQEPTTTPTESEPDNKEPEETPSEVIPDNTEKTETEPSESENGGEQPVETEEEDMGVDNTTFQD